MTATGYRSSQRFAKRLSELGFWPVGPAHFASDRLRLELGQPWSTAYVRRSRSLGDPLTGQLGLRGPWKRVSQGKRCRLLADVPTKVLLAGFDPVDDESGDPLARLIGWLQQTVSGESSATWQPPGVEEINSWCGPEKLTVSAATCVRQGTVDSSTGRLLVRVPIVSSLPPQLPESRSNWLRHVLIDAQNRHRMVRIGFVGEPYQLSIVAEFDLSGAPLYAVQALFTASLAAMKHAVQWSIQPVVLLADPSIDFQALEFIPHPKACESWKGDSKCP